jgi:hypothetical protein
VHDSQLCEEMSNMRGSGLPRHIQKQVDDVATRAATRSQEEAASNLYPFNSGNHNQDYIAGYLSAAPGFHKDLADDNVFTTSAEAVWIWVKDPHGIVGSFGSAVASITLSRNARSDFVSLCETIAAGLIRAGRQYNQLRDIAGKTFYIGTLDMGDKPFEIRANRKVIDMTEGAFRLWVLQSEAWREYRDELSRAYQQALDTASTEALNAQFDRQTATKKLVDLTNPQTPQMDNGTGGGLFGRLAGRRR